MKLKTRKSYDTEFKRNTAALYVEGHQSLSELSEELDVAESTLYNWVSEYRKYGQEAFKPKELSAHEKEVLALKKELSDTRMERDILKKANKQNRRLRVCRFVQTSVSNREDGLHLRH